MQLWYRTLTPHCKQWIDLPKKKIKKDIVALNNNLDQMDLINIHRAFHLKEEKHTFFSNAHDSFSKIDHMIGHKSSLNEFKKIEIISSIFSDCNGLKLETHLKEKNSKTSKNMETEKHVTK